VKGEGESDQIIYVEKPRPMSKLDRDLIDVFCANLPVAIANIRLNAEVEHTQREIVFTLGAIAEARSKETGFHVKRVAEYSRLLALRYGLPEEECELLKLASPLHDIGKMAIPDAVLNKPGRHTPEEWEIMKTHSVLGYDMLKHSNQAIFRAAAILARSHHEKWDGTGYPDQLAGEDIHIYGRITALADVFDALGSRRCYKEAWDIDDILAYLREHSGQQFDPKLVEIFFAHMEDFIAIRDRYVDSD
jgi:response regulator RpfG family c-di-GMP phosphodiesterase